MPPRLFDTPRQAVMGVPGVDVEETQRMAERAAQLTKQYLPRATGAAAGGVSPIWGEEWFGVEWKQDSVWFQDQGIQPFTMRNLAGKTIPMWVKDKSGELRRNNPKIKTRVRADTGETEVMIFRKAAPIGQRRQDWRMRNGRLERVDVPASYPGAPGRIAVNRSQGQIRDDDGKISKGNVGVRWRHPGLDGGAYIARGMSDAAAEFGVPVEDVQYLPESAAAIGDSYKILMTRQ